MFFLRKSTLERLPVAMSGVRMGERVLQIGVDDASLVGAIAVKVGLSGHAAVAVADRRQAAKARAGAASSGALVDVQETPLDALPFADEAFDVVVLHAGALAHTVAEEPGVAVLSASRRVLRQGGRIVVIEGGPRGLFGGRRAAPRTEPAAALGALTAAGLKAARLLAEHEGYRFLEAVR